MKPICQKGHKSSKAMIILGLPGRWVKEIDKPATR